MPLINYTTVISSSKTVAEIQTMLGKAHASHTFIKYDAKAEPVMLVFELQGQTYMLGCRAEAVYKVLQRTPGVPNSLRTLAQGYRVGWRIVKEWLAVNLALIELNMADAAEVFMPYMVTNPNTQETMYQAYKEHKKLLEAKP